MGGAKYYLIEASMLPKVCAGVLDAKRYLQTGEAKSVSAAVKMAGISRGAYYKYKDKILEYTGSGENTATISAKLEDSAGVLNAVMTVLYEAGTNVLAVSQSVPVDGIADVSITVRLPEEQGIVQVLQERIKNTGGVRAVSLV